MPQNDLEKLSDAELHRKLIENGFQSFPVTETTRKLLIKKLQNHLKNEKALKHQQNQQQHQRRRQTDGVSPSRNKTTAQNSFANKTIIANINNNNNNNNNINHKINKSNNIIDDNDYDYDYSTINNVVASNSPIYRMKQQQQQQQHQQHSLTSNTYQTRNSNIIPTTLPSTSISTPSPPPPSSSSSSSLRRTEPLQSTKISPIGRPSIRNYDHVNYTLSPQNILHQAAPPSPSSPPPPPPPIQQQTSTPSPQSSQYQQSRPSLSPRVFAPPPIMAAESSEDEMDYMNTSTTSNNNMRRNLSSSFRNDSYKTNGNSSVNSQNHFGVVNRLLSFRDSTLRKQSNITSQQQPTQCAINNNEEFIRQQQQQQRYYAAAAAAAAQQRRSTNNNSKFYTPNNSHNRQQAVGPYKWWKLLSANLDPQQIFRQSSIPQALIGAFIIFLILITSVYLFKNPDLPNSITEANTHFTLCDDIDEYSTITMNNQHSAVLSHCIRRDLLQDALKLNQNLIRLLQERAIKHYCVDDKQPEGITALDFIHYLYQKGLYTDIRKLLQHLISVEYLIKRNPQWKVNLSTLDKAPSTVPIHDFEHLMPQQKSQYNLLKPHLPFTCSLYNKLQRFFILTGTLVLITAIGGFIYWIVRAIRNWRIQRALAIEQFTSEIIQELMHRSQHGETAEEREIIINHMRDKLIPLTKRSELLGPWCDALRLLEANDSRIQFGIRLHNGEEFRIMKWTGTVNTIDGRDRSGCVKKWQSPAFDNAEKITNPPTPCLKIRHMFDASEINHPNLKQVIEKSIFEKVGNRCKICDIQLDKQSCCVYVRCASEADAGVIHNEINGWWFDNRLVSIKFLRLQRYESRFPKSLGDTILQNTNLTSTPAAS